MGVFDEACFCDLLRDRLNKEWNEIIERAEKEQKEEVEKLEGELKKWMEAGAPLFKKVTLWDEGANEPVSSIEEAVERVKEAWRRRGLSSKRFYLVYKKDEVYDRVATLTIRTDDTVEGVRRKLQERYRKLFEEYERAKKSLAPFIDWDRLKKVGEIAALKKQIC